jgi:hypothetical protein
MRADYLECERNSQSRKDSGKVDIVRWYVRAVVGSRGVYVRGDTWCPCKLFCFGLGELDGRGVIVRASP